MKTTITIEIDDPALAQQLIAQFGGGATAAAPAAAPASTTGRTRSSGAGGKKGGGGAKKGGKKGGGAGKGAATPPADDKADDVLTADDLGKVMKSTIAAVGQGAVRTLFKEQGFAKLSDIPENKRAAFAAELVALKELAE